MPSVMKTRALALGLTLFLTSSGRAWASSGGTGLGLDLAGGAMFSNLSLSVEAGWLQPSPLVLFRLTFEF
jgi:hypothetical protein